jgi:hypothetical protein
VKRRLKTSPRLSKRPPDLSIKQILEWADEWYLHNKRWPTNRSGRIPGSLGETWFRVDSAMRRGGRGLPYRTSLAKLLAQERKVRNCMALPVYTVEQILLWADAHYLATKQWPKRSSGKISAAPEETWSSVDAALYHGQRGLLGGSSLAKLLAKKRKIRNQGNLPPFRQEQILAWADAYFKRIGTWPTHKSGAILEAPGETWMAVDAALVSGLRGCPGGSTLRRLLAQHRNVPHLRDRPKLTVEQILAWADDHYRSEGKWPNKASGPISGVPATTWLAVDSALRNGCRGLPGGTSLCLILKQHRLGE